MDNRTIEDIRKNEDKLIAESTEWENKYYILQDNWYELEKWLKEKIDNTNFDDANDEEEVEYLIQRKIDLEQVLNKINEIKDGKNELFK